MFFDLNTVMSGITTETSLFWKGWNVPIDNVLLFIWFVGAFIFGMYILTRNVRFWIIVKNTLPVTNDRTHSLLEECRGRLNIRKDVDVLITDKVKSPALFGYFHPRLLLPEGILEKLNYKDLNYVFMHEMGHLKRHDIAVNWIMTVFLIVHWFNPLVWLAFYQMRIDQETACDALVLSRMGYHQSIEYGNAIVGFLEKYCRNQQLPSLAGILENNTQMKRRLTMIVNYKRYSKTMTIMAFGLLLTTGLIFFALTGFAQDTQMQTNNNDSAGDRYGLSEVDEYPQVIKKVDPLYPEEAKEYHIEGRVTLRFIITKHGVVRDVRVTESEPAGVFDQAAIDAIEQHIFKPATKDGEAVDCIVNAPMEFLLKK